MIQMNLNENPGRKIWVSLRKARVEMVQINLHHPHLAFAQIKEHDLLVHHRPMPGLQF